MNAIPIRTSLQRAPSRPLKREELDPLRERAWQEQGLICLYPDEVTDDWARQSMINQATKRFGKRMRR